MAAFTADANMVKYTLQIALCHLFFNISGIIIWYPIPLLRRVPISLAKRVGITTADYRWFAVFYLLMLYLLLPLAIFGLSLAGLWVMLGVLIAVIVLIVVVVIVNVLQSKRPQWLPECMRTWDFLPLPLHSLKPYDDVITMCFRSTFYRKYCRCCCRDVAEADARVDDDDNEKSKSGAVVVVINVDGEHIYKNGSVDVNGDLKPATATPTAAMTTTTTAAVVNGDVVTANGKAHHGADNDGFEAETERQQQNETSHL